MKLKNLVKLFLPKYQKLILEYKVQLRPRYGHGRPPHGELYSIINAKRSVYASYLNDMLAFTSVFHSFKSADRETDTQLPAWNNGFLPGLDIMALYSFVSWLKPNRYLEIGSGNSTKVARKAIRDGSLATEIISIDPFPRASIDHLANEVIRQPLEQLSDPSTLSDMLQAGDILFIDNSHRCLPNSDVAVCFLELLPRLRPGVIVHIHDIYLPDDYPQDMCDRFYSEQYMLAAFLLANPAKYEVIFPCWFVSQDKELAGIIESVWKHPNTAGVERHGGSFWLRVN
jgi:hypothetical protein